MFVRTLKYFKSVARAGTFVSALGGEIQKDNVTKTIDYFVVGENPPLKRLSKAQHLKLKIYSETDFINLIQRLQAENAARQVSTGEQKKNKSRVFGRGRRGI